MTPWSYLQIEDIKQSLKLKQIEEVEHQKRIRNTRLAVEDLKAELAKVGDQPELTPMISALNVKLRGIQEERAKIEAEKADLRRERDNLCAQSKGEFSTNRWMSGDPFYINKDLC